MSKLTDIKPVAVTLYCLPVETRIPYRFGTEELKSVVCVRARVEAENRSGERATGWGEAPLSAAWAWPSSQTFAHRQDVMIEMSGRRALQEIVLDRLLAREQRCHASCVHRRARVEQQAHAVQVAVLARR